MRWSTFSILALIYGVSEIALAFAKRSGRQARSRDRQSLPLLWIVIFASIFCAFSAFGWFPEATMTARPAWRIAGQALFIAGLLLRWWSIWYLGKYFTVNVAVHSDHRLVDTGPYRRLRHPSYTGALLIFAGLGLTSGNWAAFAFLVVPITIAFLLRIRVEEAVLEEALGETYRAYRARTQRLLPFIY